MTFLKSNERIKELWEQCKTPDWHQDNPTYDHEKFAELIIEECAREVEVFARKWWSIHCYSNKHAETTRKAHDDFCALQAAIRRRGTT
jgi:hypothetical protein